MARPLLGLMLCLILALAGGVVWLAVSDVGPSPQIVQQVLPDANFPR
ncbi:MAG: hypothetical protein WBK91_06295 [Alphaproteobacteria bacterium]